MTALAEDLRAQLRGRRKRPAPEPWKPPQVADFTFGEYVLAFDATLSHTGWVVLGCDGREIVVLGHGAINPATEMTGYRGTWDKAIRLLLGVTEVMRQTEDTPLHVVVEAPSVGGGHRTESSLIAGLIVLMAYGNVTDVSASHVSAVLLGDARMRSEQRKKLIREAVIRLIPETAGRGWNEHMRDAAATALTYIRDHNRKATDASLS